MRSPEEVLEVRDFIRAGVNDCEISRITGVPGCTVRDWRLAKRWRTFGPTRDGCDTCGRPEHEFSALPASYAHLLGLYLGDGCLSAHPRGVYRLRISLDLRYPLIVARCERAMAEVLPDNCPGSIQRPGCVEVGISSKQLLCLFPQHAPGPKHLRRIELVDWQQRSVERHPEELVRGLIHSDGCRSINTVRRGDRVYRYPRYQFCNHSADIRQIFCDACDLLGIEWRVMKRWNISVARRASVARLDEFVGPKA